MRSRKQKIKRKNPDFSKLKSMYMYILHKNFYLKLFKNIDILVVTQKLYLPPSQYTADIPKLEKPHMHKSLETSSLSDEHKN